MYLLTYHIVPGPQAEDVDDIGGAYINCYICGETLEEADKIAREEIEAMKWNVLSREDTSEIVPESINDDEREYYEAALIENEVYVLHTYPIVDMDEE